jgi:hypothetical protein
VQPVAATPQREFELVPYCMKRINESTTAAGLCELIDKMLVYPKLIEDEQRFEEVCQFVSAVNRSRRDDANLNWTREDWQQVVDRLAYRMTAADLQREAMNPSEPGAHGGGAGRGGAISTAIRSGSWSRTGPA